MLFRKKRNVPQDAPKERVTIDETGKITIRARFGDRKTTPPKIAPTTDYTSTLRTHQHVCSSPQNRIAIIHAIGKAMLFWKKRTAPQTTPKERVSIDETGKITIRVRFGDRKITPPKIAPPPTP